LREGRFDAPRDEGQNEEGGPHHSLHRVLHSRESCSTVTDEIVRIQYLLPHELAVEFRRATGSGLDLVQKFPQIHFFVSAVGRRSELCSKLLSVTLMKDSVYRSGRVAQNEELGRPGREAEAEEEWGKGLCGPACLLDLIAAYCG
jgi:hypothetical protein